MIMNSQYEVISILPEKKVSIFAKHFGTGILGIINDLGKHLAVNLRYA